LRFADEYIYNYIINNKNGITRLIFFY